MRESSRQLLERVFGEFRPPEGAASAPDEARAKD
jgi:hypothetical protein